MTERDATPKVGIVVVAYNAASTLAATLDRIPPEVLRTVAEIIISDDASHDDTFEHARRWSADARSVRTTVVRHTKNLGYGGNQKAAYRLAIEHGLDIVVLLHGDGQYAPECLPQMVEPLLEGDAAAVFGSRMMVPGAAKQGGMPFYKRVGNRILTTFENRVLGTRLTEFHSGYRAYSTRILKQIPFEANSDGFDFDTQIIAQIVHAGGRIVEIPIPTYYGDEICYVNGMKYARDVVRDVVEFKLASKGFGTQEWVQTPEEYQFKEGDGSSHAALLAMLERLPTSRILDLGCSGGLFAERARAAGHHVTGVDVTELPGVRDRTDEFFVADLQAGIPAEVGSGFDVVVAGDVIEHLARPVDLLKDIRAVLRPGGQLLLSVPNFGHWYPRARVATGLFGYDRRGILDSTHLHFFTRSTLRRAVRAAGFDIVEEAATGLPLGAIGSGEPGRPARALQRLDAALVRARPTLFGYQHVLRLVPHREDTVYADDLDETGAVDDGAMSARPDRHAQPA
ncbi:MAG TPA: bifunctional glycosyltransferase/class I SAM-dependent methyltransferase [Kineosporiaceae bacterium]|nr:bifunctional glycosyltransferase/class I SAM-dependent methyltransferase [Kineosporiaceae bacterium]